MALYAVRFDLLVDVNGHQREYSDIEAIVFAESGLQAAEKLMKTYMDYEVSFIPTMFAGVKLMETPGKVKAFTIRDTKPFGV